MKYKNLIALIALIATPMTFALKMVSPEADCAHLRGTADYEPCIDEQKEKIKKAQLDFQLQKSLAKEGFAFEGTQYGPQTGIVPHHLRK